MEDTKRDSIYRAIMLIVITAIVTFMITSIGMYNYLTKTQDGKEKIISDIEVTKEIQDLNKKLQIVKEQLEKKYIGDLNYEEMEEIAIKGYVAGVNDDYTEYLTKSEYEDLMVNVTGDYVGIGIYMTQDSEGNVLVVMPIEGSPALEADLRTGDMITKIDGEDCKGMDLNLVSTKIKGKENTSVELEIVRDNETITKKIIRRNVEIQTSSSKILDGNIGYIELSSFDEGCTAKLEKYLDEFQKKGVKSVIFDFRNNTGGLVSEAIKFSELFIPKGKTIMCSYNKEKEETIITSKNSKPMEINIVVLVNGYSASATEIVTGALKDNKVATIVGTTTFGKGVMQEIFPLFNGALKVTIEEFKTPNGDKIQKQGIEPDIRVENNIETEEDEQLQKAIEILK